MEDRKSRFLTACAITALTVLAPAMGGSVALWAEGTLAVGVGLVLLLAPPRRSLGLLPNLGFAALLLIALTAFLPMRWFTPPDWWLHLTKLGARIPESRSPQPWLTWQWTCFLLLVLGWTYYLLTFQWRRSLREKACVAFGIGILGLAGALTAAFITKLHIPFWPHSNEFGFFPNRNQTSNVLGLGGVMIYALGLERFQENRRYWWLWFVSLSLVCWALIIDSSRAGIILFFCGALAVHIFWWMITREQRRPLIAFGGLALLIALFLIDGGATLLRFQKETAAFLSPEQNYRLHIYRDAINLISKSPLLGIGLGNFLPVFALNQNYSASMDRVAHPESDWLWSGVDLGLIGLLLGLVLFLWWLKQCLPFNAGTSRLLRVAGMVCAIGFAIHGIFDVSGHRLGALWPALFFGSIAIHPENEYRRSKAVAVIFRLTGAILMIIGGWWIASVCGAKTPPTSVTVDRLRSEINAAVAAEDYNRVLLLTSEALTIAPLDWEFYFKRGVGEAASWSTSEAERDFAIARYLLPNWPELYLREGQVWFEVAQPDLGFAVLAEGMRRLPNHAPNLYSDIFGSLRSDPALRDDWRKLAENDKRCVLIFLREANSTELELELQELLSAERPLQNFTPDELRTLFSTWYKKGDKLDLAQTLQENPEWKKIGWRRLAEAYADYQDYRQAFETAADFLPKPPADENAHSPDSILGLSLRFRSNPDDPDAGFGLALAQRDQGKIDEALLILQKIRDLPRAPESTRVLEGELWARKQDWKRAWGAIAPLVFADDR
ncbi:MAG TPA: O-antigen ligase family protein [Candidatus Acidoferrum sp.]|nr:O-antigen ligase family protein [Candidatus Acidoferrum sp.]